VRREPSNTDEPSRTADPSSRIDAGIGNRARVDPTLEGRALQDALRAAIAYRRGYCWWTVAHAGWVVTLDSPERQEFSGRTLDEARAWWLVWLMAPELGVGPFRVCGC
jgi:hypothetical protein